MTITFGKSGPSLPSGDNPQGTTPVVGVAKSPSGPIYTASHGPRLVAPSSYYVLSPADIAGMVPLANASPASFYLVRTDDLLVLFASLYSSGNSVFIRFDFPAQHIAESTGSAGNASETSSIFDDTPLEGPVGFPRSAGPFGWINSDGPTGLLLEEPSSETTLRPMWWSDLRLPGTSLLFRVTGLTPTNPEALSLLSQPVATLLDWSSWSVCIGPKAASAGLFASANLPVQSGPPAAADATAGSTLDMMFGMAFTPTERGAWTHVDSPMQTAMTGRVELWHTRLVPSPQAPRGSTPTMRAAWSLAQALAAAEPPDFSNVLLASTAPPVNLPTQSPAPVVYDGLWPATGLPLPASNLFVLLRPPNAWVPQPSTVLTGPGSAGPGQSGSSYMEDLVQYTTYSSGAPGVELPAEDVLLSAAGGSLKTGADFSAIMGANNHLISLSHEQHLGRDVAAQNLGKAWLGPFGQPALYGEFFLRVVDPLVTNSFATIQQRNTLQLLTGTVSCPLADFMQPFQSIKVINKSFPPFSARQPDGNYHLLDAGGGPTGPVVMVQYEATDAAGRNVTFELPLQILSAMPSAGESFPQSIALKQQRVAYSAGANSTFETDSISLQYTGNGFNWTVANAQIQHPAIAHFIPTGAASITLIPAGLNASPDTLAQLEPPTGPLGGTGHYDQYGAFAAPTIPSLSVLSKSIGAAGAAVPAMAAAMPATTLSSVVESLFGTTQLLGVFPLASLVNSILSKVPGASTLPLPNILTTNDAGKVTVTLSYDSTDNGNFNSPAFTWSVDSVATLNVQSIQFSSTTVHGPSGTTSTGACTLTAPSIQLPPAASTSGSLVSFEFNSMNFTSSSAAKPTASVDFNQVEFLGALTFVNYIMAILPSSLFSNPPEMTISDTECVIDCGVDFPSLGIGAFSLSNINLDAELTIPFMGDPISFAFNFSTVDDPFTLSVMGFAGSGSFGVAIAPNAVTVNGSLAFGGYYSVDVIVASGYVSLEAGVHITYTFSIAPGGSTDTDVGGFVHLSGGVDVLDLVSVTLDVMLSLTYDSASASFTGTAQVSLSVDVTFFHTSVSFSVSETFSGGASTSGTSTEIYVQGTTTSQLPGGAIFGPARNPFLPVSGFLTAVARGDWNDYCGAFAA
jgi:hypothetical protein